MSDGQQQIAEARSPGDMPLTQHLAELRTRLIRSVLAVVVTTGLCLNYSSAIFHILTAPLRKTFLDSDFIGTGPADAFIVSLQVSVLSGFLLASPFIFWQMWRFIEPGMHEHERKFALPFVVFCTVFFLSGVFFCYEAVLPVAFEYFYLQFTDIAVRPQIRIDEYLAFIVKMMLVFGVVFELPILSYFLARMGILKHEWLLKHFRIAIVAIFIIAAIFTPPDVVSQLLLATPLLVIYGLSIGIAYFFRRKTEEKL